MPLSCGASGWPRHWKRSIAWEVVSRELGMGVILGRLRRIYGSCILLSSLRLGVGLFKTRRIPNGVADSVTAVRGFRNRAQLRLLALGRYVHAIIFDNRVLPGGAGVVSRNGLGCPDSAADSAVVRLAVRGALSGADALAGWRWSAAVR